MIRWAAFVLVWCGVAASEAAAAEGRFGQALAVGERYAVAERNPIYFVVPMTVECWAKIGAAAGPEKARSSPTILLANEPRHSQTHWELYAQKDSGVLAAAMPGWDAKEVLSKQTIVDGRWHHVAMVFDGKSLHLYCDGAEVASAPVKKVAPYPDTGPLTFGHLPGVEANHDLLLDEVRISRVARPVGKPADAPFQPDADSIGLWHFDESADTFADASLTRNPAKLTPVEKQAPAGGGFDGTLGTRTRWSDMDYGPFFSSTLLVPSQKQNVTHKAISVRLDDRHAVAFDTELLRMSAAWSGDFLSLKPFREGLGGPPDVAGEVFLSTAPLPGWYVGELADLSDPRPDKLGPLPKDRGHYKGLYRYGDKVVFAYTVGGVDVLELPEMEPLLGADDASKDATARAKFPPAFMRTFDVGPHEQSLTLAACDLGDAKLLAPPAAARDGPARFQQGDRITSVFVPDAPKGAFWQRAEGNRLLLQLAPSAAPTTFRLVYLHFQGGVPKLSLAFDVSKDLSAMPLSIPRTRQEPIITKGVLGSDAQPYTVDTLTPPVDNPWKSFLRFGGLDFFSNGDAAVCSVSGDVWVVSGIDDTLKELKWRRYATGLFQPLGLRIVDDVVYVLGRDQITRLHDLNHDGEADFYENFNNDAKVTTNAHAYVTCLETDPAGNFYYLKCGDNTEHGGTVLRVSRDGRKLDVFATGLRNPNGLGVSPTGVVTEADNQGEWVPASRLDVVNQGQFLGFQPMSKRNPPPTDPGTPLCWMPQNVDNSSGGQTWVPDERWGPFKDYMVHTSYGAAAILLVLQDKGDGPPQGGVVRFPFTFDSGVMRARFRKQDGQLYVCGLRGWQTAGVKDACLQRVRYTGKPVYMPSGIAFLEKGIRLSFTCPLAADVANDADSYSILRWNYHWSAEYGSRQWSISDPTRQGYDTVKVKSAKLQPDGRTVVLEVEDMRAAMQIQVGYDLEASDGTQVRGDVYGTAHVLRR